MDVPAHADALGIPEPSAPATVPPSSRERGIARWRWATHCLLGLLLGSVGAALQREPWNEPIHWANVVPNLVVLPLYFLVYTAFSHSLRGVGLAICTVVLSEAVAFNAMFYVLHDAIDRDFVVSPLALLAGYLVLFVGCGLVLRFVRRLSRHQPANAA